MIVHSEGLLGNLWLLPLDVQPIPASAACILGEICWRDAALSQGKMCWAKTIFPLMPAVVVFSGTAFPSPPVLADCLECCPWFVKLEHVYYVLDRFVVPSNRPTQDSMDIDFAALSWFTTSCDLWLLSILSFLGTF